MVAWFGILVALVVLLPCVANGREMKVGLVQINNSFSGQNYLPYSVALLQAYVEKHAPGKHEFLPLIYKRAPIDSIVESLKSADLVGFSIYVWNERISLEIARRLRKIDPFMRIVFGGPQVPDDPTEFLRANRHIDFVVHNEGERAFLDILEGRTNPLEASVRYDRLRDLEEIPSPFLSGTFGSTMQENPDEKWIGLWETNRGCPHFCQFCDWGSATASKVARFGMERLQAETDWFADHRIEYIFTCDANFGILPRDVDIAKYVAKVKAETGYPSALSVQNTKNATERAYQTQKILNDAGLNKGVSLSMQSLDPATLHAVKRDNISLETYYELQRRFTRDGVETYCDLILGLPGETYDSFANGVDKLIASGQHNRIQFNNLSILPNAGMGDPAYQKRYGMVTVQSEIINIHGERIKLEDDVPEYQQLVIATDAMPLADWRRARVFAWWCALLVFDKLFAFPLHAAHEKGRSYREMIEAFMAADQGSLRWINRIFHREARSIQQGGPEYIHAPEYLDIYWPADEWVFIALTHTDLLEKFYREASQVVQGVETEAKRNQAQLNLPGEDFQKWCREVVWWGNKRGGYLRPLAGHT